MAGIDFKSIQVNALPMCVAETLGVRTSGCGTRRFDSGRGHCCGERDCIAYL